MTDTQSSDEFQALVLSDEFYKNYGNATGVREVLHSAFAYVWGYEARQKASKTTVEQLIVQAINSMKAGAVRTAKQGEGAYLARISRLDQIEELERLLLGDGANEKGVIARIKEAGDDKAALNALGIYEADMYTTPQDAPSTPDRSGEEVVG